MMRGHAIGSSLDALGERLRNLTPREIEVLAWLVAGKSQHDIGIILGISCRTVEAHVRAAKCKLDAVTTIQACVRAVAGHAVDPA